MARKPTKKKPKPKPARKPPAKKRSPQRQNGGRPRIRPADWDARRKRAATQASQDIGEIPPCKNPKRRKAALVSQQLFCETYFPAMFDMEWSADHLRILPKTEVIVDAGGKKAIAMPRGSGKTVVCLSTVLRALLSGKHPYAFYIGATVKKQEEGMSWFKSVLLTNDLLLEDFPEVCYPIRKMNGEPRRCLGQTSNGLNTKIKWSPNQIVFPIIKGSPLSGFSIAVSSMESAVRGGFILLPDGRMPRPSLAVVDDPQTDESAVSQGPGSQTEKRLLTIRRAIQGLAGPNGRISMFIPCTVIERGDLADQILDRKKFPDFHGERTKRLYSWPTNMKLWDQYRDIREDCQRADEPPTAATEFYRARMCQQGRKLDAPGACAACQHKDGCMDCGAVIDWAARLDNKPEMPEEYRNISSLQAAMHSLYEYGPAGFASEFQNEPLQSETAARLPSAEEIMAKANGYPRGLVPAKALHLTSFIDVGDDYLFWLVAGWAADFTGWVLDYGTFPDQGSDFSKASVRRAMATLYPGTAKDGAILAGIQELAKTLLSRQFPQEGGPPQQIGLCLVDTGYKPDAVHAAIRLVGRPTIRPSRGRGITAGKTQFEDYKKDRCREIGHHWWVPKESAQSVIHIDTNFYKTFTHARIATAMGDPGALTLFGKPSDHKLLAAHILAEYYTLPSTERGVAIQEWHQHVGQDNEGFDALVGAAVAAAKLGCSVLPAAPKAARPVVSYAQRVAARSA